MAIKSRVISKTYTYTISVWYSTPDTILDPEAFFDEAFAEKALKDAGLSPYLSLVNSQYSSVTMHNGINTYHWTATYSE